ncbi:hypothetical protein HYS48_02680 [Candidatus Woesearchaeota archaeon]|nr:hypothetical protein [Candidatus Woesearchaeota archaeon]
MGVAMKEERVVLLITAIVLLFVIAGCTIPSIAPPRAREPVESEDKALPAGCNNDGKGDPGEACDDGNFIENDACDKCRPTTCGDSIVNDYFANSENLPEACDPGKEVDEQGFVPGTKLTPQQYGNRQCSNNTGVNTAVCIPDKCICVYEDRPVCGNNLIEGGWTPFGWRGEGCDAPGNQALGDLQCLFLGLGDTCNLNACSCSGCNYDGVVDAGEQCDDGNFIANDECDACVKTHCGDGILDDNPKNWDGIKEECGEPGAPACPADTVCKECQCKPKKAPGNDSINETITACKPNGQLDAGEQCDPGVPALGKPPQGCPEGQYCEQDCKCKSWDRVITPRCGDGYVSTAWGPGGGNEECDIGGGYSNIKYPPAPDTCPPGMKCAAPETPNQCKCLPIETVTGICPEPYETLDVCQSYCPEEGGECDYRHQTDTGERCYYCYVPSCPSGTTEDLKNCEKQCPGKCQEYEQIGEKICYQCLQYQCPQGTVSDQAACQKQCTTGDCVVAAEKEGFQCWACKTNCEKYCTSKGYTTRQPDYTSYIESQLNQKSCVKSAHIQFPNYLKAGDCTCYSQEMPTITFDETRPICTGTVCGDVPCGESRECNIDENTVAEVSCNWNGWKRVGEYQYVPQVGAVG